MHWTVFDDHGLVVASIEVVVPGGFAIIVVVGDELAIGLDYQVF